MPDEIDLTDEENKSLDNVWAQVSKHNDLDRKAGALAHEKGLKRDEKQSPAWLAGYDAARNAK